MRFSSKGGQRKIENALPSCTAERIWRDRARARSLALRTRAARGLCRRSWPALSASTACCGRRRALGLVEHGRGIAEEQSRVARFRKQANAQEVLLRLEKSLPKPNLCPECYYIRATASCLRSKPRSNAASDLWKCDCGYVEDREVISEHSMKRTEAERQTPYGEGT